ncbi:MAG: tat pathway signal sequence [Mycobacteriales bacterium]
MHAQPARPRRLAIGVAAALILAGVATVAVAVTRDDRPGNGSAAGRSPVGTAPPAGTGPSAPAGSRPAGPGGRGTATACGPWGCDQERRLAAAAALLRTRPGLLGITVLDRRTGAVWTAGTDAHRMWASSTPKLALATGLLERAHAGELSLDSTARAQIDAMLAVSDDAAADALWDRFGGAALLPRLRDRYGMTGLDFVPGFPRRWGFLKCSTADLRRLMTYVLTRLDPSDREHVLTEMRHVGRIQHWGVWAAGPLRQPGTKDGWSVEYDAGRRHWCTSSVGFAGRAERYVIAVMDDLPPGAGLDAGVHAVSDVVATVFGAAVPAPVTVPAESTGR